MERLSNEERAMHAPMYDVFDKRKKNGMFSKKEHIIENLKEFRTNLMSYMNDTLGISFKVEEIATVDGIYNPKDYVSFSTAFEGLNPEQIELFKSKTSYDDFVNLCHPFIYIKYNKEFYFNVYVTRKEHHKHTSNKYYGERLLLFLDGLKTKFKVMNTQERSTVTSINLSNIMPKIAFDLHQQESKGALSILALQYLDDLFCMTMNLYMSDIMQPMLDNKYKRKNFDVSTVKCKNDSEMRLFTIRSYIPKNGDDKTVQTYTVWEAKLKEVKLNGSTEMNLSTLVTNFNESKTGKQMILKDNKSVDLDNIDEALPRGSLVSMFVSFESLFYSSSQKAIYWVSKCWHIDVDRRHLYNADATFDPTLFLNADTREVEKYKLTPRISNAGGSYEEESDYGIEIDDEHI